MATVTPNFNWPVPTSTDLVKDGAVAIEALGDSIDASLVDLKGGTTGQVLSKASNTDMDFTWVTNADGDITGVTAGTGLTGGGTSGTVSLAFDQANYGGGQYAAGKNKILNGDFNIWQRGTSSTTNGFLADRFNAGFGAATTYSQSRQTFTPGTAPVAGYEGKYFWRGNITNVGSETAWYLNTFIEDVQTLAGQTATLSFWVKGDSARNVEVYFNQVFGSGGSSSVNTQIGAQFTTSTSWQRISRTINVPSIAGKTIGTGSYVQIFFAHANPTNGFTFDLWGMQLEAGSTATPFQTATGTIQGELAACQRYYYRQTSVSSYGWMAYGGCQNTTNGQAGLVLPVQMRVVPTALEYANVRIVDSSYSGSLTTLALNTGESTPNLADIYVTGTGITGGRPLYIGANNNTGAYLAVTAEL